MASKFLNVLLVEDYQPDARATQRLWQRLENGGRLDVVTDGEQCLDYLFKRGEYTGNGTPSADLVLLDIRMPKLDGFQVLKQLRGSKEHGSLPVVILTHSTREDDLRKCYELGANAYVIKPADPEEYARLLTAINNFWGVVEVPVEP